MRKRIQKEEFSSERKENTRIRKEEVQRELRGEKPAPKIYSDRSSTNKPNPWERKPYSNEGRNESRGNRFDNKNQADRTPRSNTDRPNSWERKPYSNEGRNENRGSRFENKEQADKKIDNQAENSSQEWFAKDDLHKKNYRDSSVSDNEKNNFERKKTYNDASSSSDSNTKNTSSRTRKELPVIGNARANFGGKKLFKAHSRYEDSDKKTPEYHIDRFKENAPKKIQKKIERVEKRGDEIRLNRFIANAGICSRRDADSLIEAGEIKVNGKVITEMGYQVKPNDHVKYGSKLLSREKPVYLLLNKPKDFITTTEDPNDRKTVMELVKNATESRIYPVGRLDRNTTGLLLLTNDGELAEKLTHPSNEIAKIYQVEIDKPISEEHLEKLLAGLTLEDGEIKADDASTITPDRMVLGIKIHSGRNRIVRRMFEHLGYEVLKLDRTAFANLNKKDLPRGNWRFLNEKEVIKLKYFV